MHFGGSRDTSQVLGETHSSLHAGMAHFGGVCVLSQRSPGLEHAGLHSDGGTEVHAGGWRDSSQELGGTHASLHVATHFGTACVLSQRSPGFAHSVSQSSGTTGLQAGGLRVSSQVLGDTHASLHVGMQLGGDLDVSQRSPVSAHFGSHWSAASVRTCVCMWEAIKHR